LMRTFGMMTARLDVVLLWGVMIAGAGVFVDLLGDSRADFVVGLVSTFAQFITISAVLKGMGIHRAWGRAGRVASYVGLGIVGTIAIGTGFVAFLIPGLFLYARWLLAVPLVIGEGERMADALGESWHRTRGNTLPLMIALAVVLLPILLSMGVLIFYYPEYGPAPLPAALAANALITLGFIASWFLAAVAHAMLQPDSVETGTPAL
ncbi:MAG: hypothetical protein EOP60_06105, partial [Sphingomonadales bacterium]